MDRPVGPIRRRLQRARRMERFVQLIVGGGVALVAGLWIAALSSAWSLRWAVGAGLVALGVVGLLGGIRTEIEY